MVRRISFGLSVLASWLAAWNVAFADFQQFTVVDGLPSARIEDMTTFEGDLVFALSDAGVSRYDGARFTSWTSASGFPATGANAVTQASGGGLLVAADGGIIEWDGDDGFVLDRPPVDTFPGAINVLDVVDALGSIWIASSRGVFRRTDGVWSRLDIPGEPNGGFRRLEVTADGVVWAVESSLFSRLVRFDGATAEYLGTGSGFNLGFVLGVDLDLDGNVWATGSLGVAHFDGSDWTVYGSEVGLPINNGPVKSAFADSQGNMWFALPAFGVTRWDGQTGWTSYGTAAGLIDVSALVVTEDAWGAIWVGTAFGASRFDQSDWVHFNRAEGLVDSWTVTTFRDDTGTYWVGGLNGVASWNGVLDPTTQSGTWVPNRLVPVDELVQGIVQAADGSLWFGTSVGIAILRSGAITWVTNADGLPHRDIFGIFRDSQDRIWVSMTNGISRFDDGIWTHWLSSAIGGRPGWNDFTEDAQGRIWVAGDRSVVMWEDTLNRWTVIPPPETNLPSNTAMGLVAAATAPDGAVWMSGIWGLYRYDGPGWSKFTAADGLAGTIVWDILFDETGTLWAGCRGGLSRMKDGRIGSYTTTNSKLRDNDVRDLYLDSGGGLWIAGFGATRHYRDLLSPASVPVVVPPAASASRWHTTTWVAGFKDTAGTTFQTAFDGGPWSAPSTFTSWTRDGLADGTYELLIRAIDAVGNVEDPPASVVFTVDATPPLPDIVHPTEEVVAGEIPVVGTTTDTRFESYGVHVRPVGAESWIEIGSGTSPVTNGVLAVWNTRTFAEGEYELRVQITDDVGLTGPAVTNVVVDNEAPYNDVTSPVRITSSGGEVFSTLGEARIYFPPNAFEVDTVVRLEPPVSSSVPAALPDGASLVWPGMTVSWDGSDPAKPGTLDLTIAGIANEDISVYVRRTGDVWEFLGGTFDGNTLTLPLETSGVYAVFEGGSGESMISQGLSIISMTPRVLQPDSGDLTIGFSLSQTTPLKVMVYNRAGRLVQSVVDGAPFPSGLHAVRWNGRDRNGTTVPNGLYLVTIEALGESLTKPISVVR